MAALKADFWRTALIKKTKKNANSCVKDVEQVLKHFTGLRPGFEDYTYNDGIQRELFALEGTIPVEFRGVTYNIPVCVLLQENHPQVPPLVYVRPTSSMAIKESEHVDTSGRVYHPYLHKWNHKTCNVTSFLRILCGLFGDSPPVYSKPPETRSQTLAQQQSPPPRTAQLHQPPYPSLNSPRSSTQQPPSTSYNPQRSSQLQQLPYPSFNSPRSSQQQPPSTSYNPPRTAQQPQEQQKECVICMDNPRNSVLIPCGHLGVCMACADELQKTTKICPICRKGISQFHQVFDS